jgi:pilus assembly protein CpaC
LDYVAKVKGNGRIWLEVRPYVSEVDPSRSVLINGISVPGLRSRFLETGVELGAGQTLALAGLLQVKSETINSGLPILSDMPYLGAMFRTTREEQNEIELLITVTPNFAGPMDPHEVPHTAPGTSTQSPTDKELYWRGYVETPVSANCEPGMGDPNGLIQSAPYDMQSPHMAPPLSQPSFVHPASGGYGGGAYSPANYPTSGSMLPPPSPTPNPAAMSVGPNVPKLAQQPGAVTQPNVYYPQTASGTLPASGPGMVPGMVTSGTVVR